MSKNAIISDELYNWSDNGPSDPPVALLQQRQALVKQLRRVEPFILRGSLIERFKRGGKPGCKCAQGPGHGPKYY